MVQRELFEERRDDPHRMHGRTKVVVKSWKGGLGGATAAADRLVGFEHQHGMSGARQYDRCGEAIRAGSYNHGVVGARHEGDCKGPRPKT